MADREKVIIAFEKIISVCKEDGCDFVDLAFEDAEQILALLKEQKSDIEKLNGFINGFSKDAIVPVRCKDCAYLNRDPRFMNYGYCSYFKDEFYAKVKPDKNFYCGAGKRQL